MKDIIRQYIELSEEEKNNLCKQAIIVFDTNVFLNLYRFSNDTRTALLDTMHKLSDRIWIPSHFINEFMRDRYEVIFEASNRYDKLLREGNSFIANCIEQLRLQGNSDEIVDLQNYIQNWLIKHKASNLIVVDYSNDVVLDNLLTLLDGKIGNGFSIDEIEQIKKEGAERYKKKIPPGYKDGCKADTSSDNNAYGDLIAWKEILKYASENQKDIIFVTHDQKEDWWNRIHGKTIGPRVELRKEFYDTTQRNFHMYNMYGFIQQFSDTLNSINPKIALEIRTIERKSNKRKSQMSDEERLMYSIKRLNDTIQKQEDCIRTLNKKYGSRMPKHIFDQYQNTIENLNNKKKELDLTRSKLFDLQAKLNFMDN